MPRLRCLKCNKFFDSENKKTNKLCSRCKMANKGFDSSVDLSYMSKNYGHRLRKNQ